MGLDLSLVARRLARSPQRGKAPLPLRGKQRYALGMADTHKLEEQIAHLTRHVDELSDVVARQDRLIDRLQARVDMLMQREAERELDAGGSAPMADKPPPHW